MLHYTYHLRDHNCKCEEQLESCSKNLGRQEVEQMLPRQSYISHRGQVKVIREH